MSKTDLANSFEVVVGEDNIHQRLDRVVTSHPLIASRTQAALLIEAGLVLVNGKTVKSSYKVELGDQLFISLPMKQATSELVPYNFPLDILFEDDELLVVNKPAGLVVHPALGHHDKTLVNALVYHTKNLSMGFGENRPGIVHRLDKETSGLLVVAKNNFSHEHLAQQFQQRKVHRRYWAMVYGEVLEKTGRIETLIARHPKDRKRFSSNVAKGKVAITNFKTLEIANKTFSLLEMRLETGRTHQIRVHLTDKGFPIIGDSIYGSDKRAGNLKSIKLRALIKGMSRIALHAKELGFIHPKTHEELFFNSELPEDLKNLFHELGFLYVGG